MDALLDSIFRLISPSSLLTIIAALVVIYFTFHTHTALEESRRANEQLHLEKNRGLIKWPEDKARMEADAFDLATLRKEFYENPFLFYHGK